MRNFGDQLDVLQTWLEDLAGAILTPTFAYIISRSVLTWGLKLHWVVGGLLSVPFAVVVALLLVGLTRSLFKKFEARVVLSMFATIVLLAASVCSTWSYILLKRGLAHYESSGELHPGKFADLYVWQMIDMIPGFKVWETLGIPAPVKAQGFYAGLPILMFRVCVGLPIVALFTKWYKSLKPES